MRSFSGVMIFRAPLVFGVGGEHQQDVELEANRVAFIWTSPSQDVEEPDLNLSSESGSSVIAKCSFARGSRP